MAMKTRYTTINGEVIAEKRNGVRREYVPDPLGSTVAMLDNTQTQVDTFTYWPYGEVRTSTGTTPPSFQFVGTQGYFSDGTGRTYVRARYLHTQKGRWLTRDPIGFDGQDPNLYAYCQTTPLIAIDRSGLISKIGSKPFPFEQPGITYFGPSDFPFDPIAISIIGAGGIATYPSVFGGTSEPIIGGSKRNPVYKPIHKAFGPYDPKTHEGQPVGNHERGIALPHRGKHRAAIVYCPTTGKAVLVPIIDIGPAVPNSSCAGVDLTPTTCGDLGIRVTRGTTNGSGSVRGHPRVVVIPIDFPGITDYGTGNWGFPLLTP